MSVQKAHGRAFCREGQFDGMPSLRLNMRSDCHTNEPDSMALHSGCRFGTP